MKALSKKASVIICFFDEEWFVFLRLHTVLACHDAHLHTHVICSLERFALIRSVWSSIMSAPAHLVEEVREFSSPRHSNRYYCLTLKLIFIFTTNVTVTSNFTLIPRPHELVVTA